VVERGRDLDPQVLEMLGKSDTERLNFILQDRWIDYPRGQEIMEELDYLLRQPVRTRMEGMHLTGPTKSGKTALVNAFIASKERDVRNGIFARVEIPTRATLKMFYHEVLEVFGVRSKRSETTVELHHKILLVIEKKQIRMLFIDEVQNLLESRRENLRDVLNGLKGLSNQAKIPIVLIGTEDAAATIYIDPQVANRFPRWELHQWPFSEEFRDFLHTFESLLPLKSPSNLAGKGLAREIYEYSDGLIGEVVTIIVRSADLAIRTGEESITKAIIQKIGGRISEQRKIATGNVDLAEIPNNVRISKSLAP